jgi:transcriptional regulator with XRE-family HTH domain
MAVVECAIRRPSSVDVHVGGRVRVRRRLTNVTQEALADLIGVTFQQVQKYERGTNRISASKLFAIAEALDVPISYFFDGLDATGSEESVAAEGSERNIQSFLRTGEGLELARLFPRIAKGPLRRRILELVKAAALDGVDSEAG